MYLLIPHICYFDILKSSKIDDVGFVYEVLTQMFSISYLEAMRTVDMMVILQWGLFRINVYCS